jgi:periplasmic divalent cation tolerance protein
MKLIAVVTTVPTQEDARRLARSLVQTKLAACAQIGAIESFYVWEGALQQEPEWRIVLKTTADRYGAIEAAIRQQHPYQLPAIYAVAVDPVHGPYADWVAAGSAGGDRPVVRHGE